MLKKVLWILLFIGVGLFASEVKWAKDFNSGIAQAQKEHKPVLFIFSRHSCKYCVLLEETTLKDKRVVKALNRDFVSIISYEDDNDYTPQELWRPGTPTIWFLKDNGMPMFQPIAGALGANDFLEALAIVKGEFNKTKNKGKK